MNWTAGIISLGAVLATTSALVPYQARPAAHLLLHGPRRPAARRWAAKVHPRYRTPHVTTIITGVVVAVCSSLANINELVELTNIGTLFAFVLVAAGIIVLRYTDPDRPRPFRTPLVPWVPLAAIASCVYLMFELPRITWLRFFGWMTVGLLLYFLLRLSPKPAGTRTMNATALAARGHSCPQQGALLERQPIRAQSVFRRGCGQECPRAVLNGDDERDQIGRPGTRLRPRPRPARFHDGRRRVDDRLGHLHRLGRHRAAGRQSPGWLLVAWLRHRRADGRRRALSYGELAAMMPRAGGQYVYLREAFSPLWGFLYGWTLFLVIQTGTIAAVAVGFARYLGVLVPGDLADDTDLIPPIHLSAGYALSLSTQQLVGDPADRAADVDQHARPASTASIIQNVFTTAKTARAASR